MRTLTRTSIHPRRSSRVLLSTLLGLAALTVAPDGAQARLGSKGPFGLGIGLGEPTQLVGKLMLDRNANNALQFGLSWSFRHSWLGGTVDYTYQFWNVIPKIASGAIEVPLYVGIGGAAYAGDSHFVLGPRIPVGIALAWTRVPIEVYLEAAPYLFIIPDMHFTFGGQLGARWYF